MKKGGHKKAIRPRHILGCLVLGLLLLAGVAVSQSGKLDEIYLRQEELTTAYDTLLLEQNRLEYMKEYAQTDEYLQQYAREKFGYLGPNDYKFYIEE